MLPLRREHGFTTFSYHKINGLCIILSLIFNAFSKPLPEATFGGPKRRCIHTSAFFYGLWVPARPQNAPLERNFQSKKRKKTSKLSSGNLPGADLGAIWRRKRSEDAVPLILGHLSVDFGRILNKFGTVCL